MNPIQEAVFTALPKHKRAPSGWYSFNAVCCQYNGEGIDKRGRGGVITDGEGVSYHCFNCSFKTGWKPGRHISYKFRKLLEWLGVNEAERQRLVFEALRIKETIEVTADVEQDFTIEFKSRPLPDNAINILEAPLKIQDYCDKRCIPKDNLLWSNSRAGRMYNRVIIPFTWQGKVIGNTARATDSTTKPKYFNNYEPNYVYGVDNQNSNAKFVIICEGVIDALSINGVSILGNRANEIQAQIIDMLGREIILVPDRDKPGQRLIDDALEYGWSVSFPEWENDVKDINAAIMRYGKLFTLKSIVDAKQTSQLKINLMRKNLV